MIGIKIDIDPGLTVDDKLVGNVLTNRINGIVTDNFDAIIIKSKELSIDKTYIFNINSNNINGKITSTKDNNITIKLDNYQYIDDGDIISISLTNNNTIIPNTKITVTITNKTNKKRYNNSNTNG